MWILVSFDYIHSNKGIKRIQQFMHLLISDGFSKINRNIYVRHCSSNYNALLHKKRIIRGITPKSDICIFIIPDNNFELSFFLFGRSKKENEKTIPKPSPIIEFF
jgi:CRISPR-associated protein Cas2